MRMQIARMTLKRAALLCVPLSLFSSIIAFASDSNRFEELLVTAQKRSENSQQVPIAIEVLDGQLIQRTGALDLNQVELVVPSLNFGRGERKTRGEITIRGVGDFSRNIGTNARVAIYIDDVPLGRSSAFNADLFDIKQIEILKGPQGTLFGTSTVAGAINITTLEPKDEFALKGRVDVGNFGQQLLSFKTDLPFSEKFKSSFHFNSVENDGFIENLTRNETLQGTDLDSGRIQLAYQVNNQVEVSLNLDWLEESIKATNGLALEEDGLFNGFLLSPNEREVAHDTAEFEQREIGGGAFKVGIMMDAGFLFESITGYRLSEFEEQSEEDYSPIPFSSSRFGEEFKQISQEFRLVSPKNDIGDFVIGAFFSDQNIETERSALLLDTSTGNTTSVVTPGELDSITAAIFANGNYWFTPSLGISLGFRLQQEEKELDYQILDTTGLFINDSTQESETFSSFLPKVGLNFRLDNSGLVYYSISKGSKNGGWNADFVTSLEDISFEQEFATNFEVGYKNDLFNGALNFNLVAFKTDFTDFQVFQFVNDNGTTRIRLTNAGEATSKGLELNTRMGVTEYTTLTANAAYTEARFDKFEDGGGSGVNFNGNTLPYAPEFTAFVALDINYPLQKFQLNMHLDYSYSDGYFSNPNNANTHEINNFYQVNGRIGLLDDDNWSAFIYGKNLTDETYLRYRDISFIGVPRGYFAAPRTYGVSLVYEF